MKHIHDTIGYCSISKKWFTYNAESGKIHITKKSKKYDSFEEARDAINEVLNLPRIFERR